MSENRLRSKPAAELPFFSVVIPCLNEEAYLPLLLNDLKKQSFTQFEVIVVDAVSTDTTVKKARVYEKFINLSILSSKKKNVSYQRNLGAKHAQAEWIVFMDADNRLPAHFLQGLRYQLDKDPSIDIFSCWLDTEAYSSADRALIQVANIALDIYCKVKPIAAGALLGTRTRITKHLQFDETVSMSEDHQFVIEAIKKGNSFKLLHDPRYVYSLRRLRHEGTLKMMRSYGQAQLFHLIGKKMTSQQYPYAMDGGKQYDKKSPTMFDTVNSFFTSASQKQLVQAKKLLALLKNMSSLDLE